MKTLTEQQINIAIAEAVGWKWFRKVNDAGHIRNDLLNTAQVDTYQAHGWVRIDQPKRSEFCDDSTVPNFCGDLNAMAQAEATLTDEQHNKYRHILAKVCGVGHANRAYGLYAHRNLVSAPAKERATAFVRALNLEPKSK